MSVLEGAIMGIIALTAWNFPDAQVSAKKEPSRPQGLLSFLFYFL